MRKTNKQKACYLVEHESVLYEKAVCSLWAFSASSCTVLLQLLFQPHPAQVQKNSFSHQWSPSADASPPALSLSLGKSLTWMLNPFTMGLFHRFHWGFLLGCNSITHSQQGFYFKNVSWQAMVGKATAHGEFSVKPHQEILFPSVQFSTW